MASEWLGIDDTKQKQVDTRKKLIPYAEAQAARIAVIDAKLADDAALLVEIRAAYNSERERAVNNISNSKNQLTALNDAVKDDANYSVTEKKEYDDAVIAVNAL
jgi:hypothetical protein